MNLAFDDKAVSRSDITKTVGQFLSTVPTREHDSNSPITIHQDGKIGSYYINCSIRADVAAKLLDLNARLNPTSASSYRANRELLLKNLTFQRMKSDAEAGREFHDIIVEYSTNYCPEQPLKVWGGQHRSKAIQEAVLNKKNLERYHGFRVYFTLTKEQRTDLALISNTNISVSNDLFDRQLEETLVGTHLREWCVNMGLLIKGEDFPDQSTRSESISVQLARTFIVNFIEGRQKGQQLKLDDLDRNAYNPYLCESGVSIDPRYQSIVNDIGAQLWSDPGILAAGKAFSLLHKAQRDAVEKSQKIENRKGFRNKALTASVLAGWSFTAGLLQQYKERLSNLYEIPKQTKDCPDPLNAKGMSTYHHFGDELTYRGLGTRSSPKDRQRMAQVFLAKSQKKGNCLSKDLLEKGVSQVIAIQSSQKGYAPL